MAAVGRRVAVKTLLTNLAMGESPRWHEGRLWFSDWGAQEIIAVDLDGNREVVLRVPFSLPFSIDWLADGRLLVVSGREGLLMRRDADGSLVKHVDLTQLSSKAWNEIVVDGRGNAYINAGDAIALVTPDGSIRRVADGGAFPNGMVVTADNSTLIMAESHGKKLTALDIAANGNLSNARIWADLHGGVPDGITMDSENTIWYADVPNKRCVRIREGGEVLHTVDLDRGCFACMLGGIQNRTLFMIVAEWRGMDRIAEVAQARTGQILTIEATSPRAGWP